MCPTMENLDLVYQETSDSKPDPFQAGSNRVVSPSRGLPLNLQQVAPAQIVLFAMRFNNKLPLFVSLVPDPLSTAVDTLSMPW